MKNIELTAAAKKHHAEMKFRAYNIQEMKANTDMARPNHLKMGRLEANKDPNVAKRYIGTTILSELKWNA